MKNTLIAIAAVLASLTFAQDKAIDIPKSDLPKSAVCVVCSAGGEGHGEEKPAAGVRYKDRAYYFCNAKEVAGFKSDPEAFIPPLFPRPAPAATFTALDGKAVKLEDYRGKVVLLDFWATWCKPCVAAMPHLNKLQAAHGGKDFTVLGVSIDEEGAKKVRPFLTRNKVGYSVLLDSSKAPAWEAFKVKGIPAVFLIDRDGKIIAQWSGKPDAKAIDKAVADAIG